jgi:hypothetical protein
MSAPRPELPLTVLCRQPWWFAVHRIAYKRDYRTAIAIRSRWGYKVPLHSQLDRVLLRLLIVFCMLLPITAGQVQTPTTDGSPLSLTLRATNNRTQFHLGEVVPLELTFSSIGHKKYRVRLWDCGEKYRYHVDPPLFVDRAVEIDAAEETSILQCGGPTAELDLEENPLIRKLMLNTRFRMDTPGKYRISVTSGRLGSFVTSNPVEIEIMSADPAWEDYELNRAQALIKLRTEKGLKEGCSVLRYLGTSEAAVTIARQYTDLAGCISFANLDEALISAPNRRAVLEELHAGIEESHRAISAAYLRTLAIVSLYQEHPDWYPQEHIATESEQANALANPPESSGLWRYHEALANREIDYAKELAAVLPQKTPEARTKSVETLLYLGRTLGHIDMPPDAAEVMRDELLTHRELLNY